MVLMAVSGKVFNPDISFGAFLVACLFFLFVWFWIVFGEMRTKVIWVAVDESTIVIRRFIGLGPRQFYDFAEIDGFKTLILSSSSGSYEYLYLMRNGKKIIKLSEFYHSNYKDLKRELSLHKCKNLGFEVFSYTNELKEIFT